MRHSVFHKRSMLEWLRICTEEGQLMPSDEAIMRRFGYETIELARTLLADLADAGEIRIRGSGPTRTISLGPVERAPVPTIVPDPPARRPLPLAPASRIDMIRAAAARLASRDTAAATRAADPIAILRPVAPPPADPAPVAVARPPLVPAKEPVMPSPPVLVRPAVPGEKRQISFYATGLLLERLVDYASAREIGMGPAVVELLAEPQAGEPVPDGKPRLSAATLRAWRASGQEFGDFLTDMIARGVADFEMGAV